MALFNHRVFVEYCVGDAEMALCRPEKRSSAGKAVEEVSEHI